MHSKLHFILILITSCTYLSCKKPKADPHIPPDVVFKTDAGYTFSDKTVGRKDSLLVGIIATKTEDDLKSYNVSFYYDGSTSGSTFYDYRMTDSEKTGYSKDIKIGSRNQDGSERWVFSVVDRDGNITQKTIMLTVKQ